MKEGSEVMVVATAAAYQSRGIRPVLPALAMVPSLEAYDQVATPRRW